MPLAAIIFAVVWFGFAFAFATHELGHYFVARWFGIIPTKVSLGDYVPIYDQVHAGTRFVVHAIWVPWGTNYNRFQGKVSVYAMIYVMFAGIAVNFLFAFIFGISALFFQSRILAAILLGLAIVSLSMGLGQLFPYGGTDGRVAWWLITKQNLPPDLVREEQ